MNARHALGLIPDRHDDRDFDFLYQAPPIIIPKFIDFEAMGIDSPIEDQGNAGSCTGHAAAAASEQLLLRDKLPMVRQSRLFAYYNGRQDKGNDTGASIRDVIKGMKKYGIPREDLWPYDIAKLTAKPSDAAYADAVDNVIESYHRILGLQSLLTAIAAKEAPTVGVQVYESFESDAAMKTGCIPMPNTTTEQLLGGHAQKLSGYFMNEARPDYLPEGEGGGWIKSKNSWGTGVGRHGYLFFPFAFFLDTRLASDKWAIKMISGQ